MKFSREIGAGVSFVILPIRGLIRVRWGEEVKDP
jgi:hypothetical protein